MRDEPTTPAPAASDELVERLRDASDDPYFQMSPGVEGWLKRNWAVREEAAARIEADAAEMERKDARIAELEGDCRSYAKTMEAIEKADARDQALIRDLEARATAAEAERDAWRARESETQEALQKIGVEFGVRGGEPRVDGVRRVLSEMRAERDMLRAALTMPDKDRRQWVLADLIATRGYFNRSDLIKMFGVSVPQASVDIRQFLAKHPYVATYNASTKRYERAALRPEAKGGREDVG